jgi:replication factor A1
MQFPGGQLSAGFVAGICRSDPRWQNTQAFVQIIEVKKLANSNAANTQAEKHRLTVSDGVHFMQAILASQLSHYVADGTVAALSIVKVTQFNVNDVNNRKLLLVLNLEGVTAMSQRLGTPNSIEGGAPVAQQQQQQPPQQQYQQQPQQQRAPAPQQQQGGAPRNNNFGQQQHHQPQQHQQQFQAGNDSIHPISALNPYQPRWTIRARCTFKPEIKNFNNEKGGGKLFSVDLLDESGEIRAVAFNEAVDTLYPLFQVDQIYKVSGGTLRFANKKFNSLKNDYEIVLDNNSLVQRIDGTNARVPKVHYSFVNIDQISDVPPNEVVDVIGIVQAVGEVSTIKTKKDNRDLQKRNITLVDTTDRSIELTLWGDHAANFLCPNGEEHPVLVVKSAKVSDYNHRSLGSTFNSRIEFNPAIDKTRELREWWDSQDVNQITNRISSLTQARTFTGGARAEGGAGSARNAPEKTFDQVKNEGLGINDTAIFKTRATVMFIKQEPIHYDACPECKKKVTLSGGQYFCHKQCQKPVARQCRYVLSFTAYDHTNSRWLSAFDEAGTTLFGVDAGQLVAMKEAGDDVGFQVAVQNAMFKTYNFTIRAKTESYEGSSMLKCSVVHMAPVDYVADSTKLIESINAMLGA